MIRHAYSILVRGVCLTAECKWLTILPGYKQAIPNASATESDEDSEYDVTSEGEEDDHTAYVLSCCGRRDYEPGCVVESRHLGEDEVESWKIRAQGGLEVYWKHRWAQPEVVENVEKWTPPAV